MSAGFAKPTRHMINAVFALAVPAGVLVFAFGINQTRLAESGSLVGHALAFSAGTFLCIALSDLLPELHFHSHDRTKLSAALVLGVVLAFVLAQVEHTMHNHSPAPGSTHDDHAEQNHLRPSVPESPPSDHSSHEH